MEERRWYREGIHVYASNLGVSLLLALLKCKPDKS